MSQIKVEGLRHVYSAGTPFERVAIDGISLTIEPGQLVGIIGHTGSGKSTFNQHHNALLQPTAGKVYCGGKDINADKYSRKAVKAQVGLVFQYPEYQLFEETVYKDIAFGPRNMKLGEDEIDARVREAADFYKIPPENILVLFDDINFDVGVMRIRRNGSDGGHNGIKSIIYQLNSDAFPRVKIGVGKSRRQTMILPIMFSVPIRMPTKRPCFRCFRGCMMEWN